MFAIERRQPMALRLWLLQIVQHYKNTPAPTARGIDFVRKILNKGFSIIDVADFFIYFFKLCTAVKYGDGVEGVGFPLGIA